MIKRCSKEHFINGSNDEMMMDEIIKELIMPAHLYMDKKNRSTESEKSSIVQHTGEQRF